MILKSKVHSERKLVTGFAKAAFIAWKLTVKIVMLSAPEPAKINIQGERFVRYEYF
jgi:hypothetical protein